jgi:hypothetical protein
VEGVGGRTVTISAAPVPGVPDLSFLAGLDRTVALAALATIVITMTLIYLGPVIRERLRPTPPAEPAPITAPQTPTVVAAVAQADDRTDLFIAHLRRQVDDLTRDNGRLRADLDRRSADLDRERAETELLQTEIDRATWRRGNP